MSQQLPASIPLVPKPVPRPRTIFAQMNLPVPLREPFTFLVYSTGRDAFFDIIAGLGVFNENELALISKAYDVAEREFKGFYRDSDEGYFEHLRRCALILVVYLEIRDANMIAAMLLHDIIEMRRRDWNVTRLMDVFNAQVAILVMWLTKRPKSRSRPTEAFVDAEYFVQLARAPRDVIVLKAVDRLDNLLTLWAKSLQKVQQVLHETQTYLLPLLRKHRVLRMETAAVLQYIRKELKKT